MQRDSNQAVTVGMMQFAEFGFCMIDYLYLLLLTVKRHKCYNKIESKVVENYEV